MRNLLTRVPRVPITMVDATVHTTFAQLAGATAHRQFRFVADMLRDRCPAAADFLHDAETDLCAYVTCG
jgi:hypothetical protein